ncbi:MAG: peptidase family protein [Devosia sp.]|nr:peptidase family protein [Devosia sp.]
MEFETVRQLAKVGEPVTNDEFANSAMLPIVVNAAYNPQINGFEVPAAILQPGVFEPDLPAPVYFCRLGAILGHEMTHGFDSRLFDADGNLRDWWTPQDITAFDAQAQKLIDQANSFKGLPGVTINGELTVTENMAD